MKLGKCRPPKARKTPSNFNLPAVAGINVKFFKTLNIPFYLIQFSEFDQVSYEENTKKLLSFLVQKVNKI